MTGRKRQHAGGKLEIAPQRSVVLNAEEERRYGHSAETTERVAWLPLPPRQ
jgi:hypothetical protein